MATEFGLRLQSAREAAGLSQKALGAAVGMGQSAISSLEKMGKGSAYGYQLALACKVHPLWLATGEGPREPCCTTVAVQGAASVGLDVSPTALEVARFFDAVTKDFDPIGMEIARSAVTSALLDPGLLSAHPAAGKNRPPP